MKVHSLESATRASRRLALVVGMLLFAGGCGGGNEDASTQERTREARGSAALEAHLSKLVQDYPFSAAYAGAYATCAAGPSGQLRVQQEIEQLVTSQARGGVTELGTKLLMATTSGCQDGKTGKRSKVSTPNTGGAGSATSRASDDEAVPFTGSALERATEDWYRVTSSLDAGEWSATLVCQFIVSGLASNKIIARRDSDETVSIAQAFEQVLRGMEDGQIGGDAVTQESPLMAGHDPKQVAAKVRTLGTDC